MYLRTNVTHKIKCKISNCGNYFRKNDWNNWNTYCPYCSKRIIELMIEYKCKVSEAIEVVKYE